MQNSLKSMVQNSSLSIENKYLLNSVISLSSDSYVEESCLNIINLNDFIIESGKELENSSVLKTFTEKANGLLNERLEEVLKYSGGHYTEEEYSTIKESISYKEFLLEEFVESCKKNISENKEIPEFNSRILLESTSISERKKNDILLEYYDMDENDRRIIDTYYEFVKFNRCENIITEDADKSEEEARKARIKAKEKLIGFAIKAVAVGTVIKVSETLYLRKLLKDFEERYGKKYDLRPISSLNHVVYDEDEIPSNLRSKLVWNDVEYSYKMEVYYHKNKMVCGRVYAYTCPKAKIKFNLLSQPKKGSVVKVNYFTDSKNEYAQNYYMMAMSLEDRIAHESIKRVANHMKAVYKEEKNK